MYITNKLLLGTLILTFFGLGVFVGNHLGFLRIVVSGGGVGLGGGGLISVVAINCGFVANSTSADGREWVGESALEVVSGDSKSSVGVGGSFRGSAPDPVPYKTSRFSGGKFKYKLPVIPGQKIIRLHFYPASYRGFEKWIDYFSVKAGPFTLLRNYSASIVARTLGVNHIVKEFCLNVEEENQELTLTFFPSSVEKPNKVKTYAFVNGIEIISMPTGLYYTPERELGARIVGLHNRLYIIDNSTALELIHRLNVGGNSINSMEDFGLYRQWNEDSRYLQEPKARQVRNLVLKIKSKNLQAFVAPAKIYHTSWKLETEVSQMVYNFKWKVPVELGFCYLVRLHFCELDYRMADRESREFIVIINNQTAEMKADVIRWSGDVGIPVFKDYVVLMDGDREERKSDIMIGLQSVDELAFGLLNGMEIFKLSDLDNNLAASDPVFPKGFSTSWNLKNKYYYLAFGRSNAIRTVMTVLIMLFSIVVYILRKIWEDNCLDEKSAESTSAELSCRCFSLSEIKLATQNFSEAFVVGKGGFGKVYRGFIPGVPDMVAIKRLNFYSKQGAREFWTEVETLTKLRHIQLVSLIGYCNECMEMILVYEYIPGGTLAENLYKFARKGKDCPPLSWEQRLKICIGAARGLEYLHTSSVNGVIHRDIKDTNILLDENFVAKISDFGLSKLEEISESKSYVSTKVKGTVGYLDPNYLTTQRLTRKTDVYCFGIVMLVVLSGKPALDAKNSTEPSLVSCFQKCVADGDIRRIVDPRLEGEISSRSLKEFVRIVENCLHQLPKRRPTMAQVVSSLEQALEKHQSHMSSALLDATLEEERIYSFHVYNHKGKMLEGSVSPPESPAVEVNTRKSTQNLAATNRGENLHRLRKSLLGWSWKAVWNRDSRKRDSLKIVRKDDNRLPSAQEVEHFRRTVAANPLVEFTLDELKAITKGFRQDQFLGEGGFGSVFKGFLAEDVKRGLQPMQVAIKVRARDSFQGHREWLAEVIFLGQLSHPNLVKLIGYCCELEHWLLVYEYMAGGSVEKDLFSRTRRHLSCSIRMKIAFGAAKGLQYLHEFDIPVIFRDFKTSNILLDLDYNAKLSDFGLAKDGPVGDASHVSTRVMGTHGYAAPEYVATGHLTPKSDVYGYGVVLLELLTGKRSIDKNRKPEEQNLINWAMPLLRDKRKLLSIVDPRLGGDYPKKDVHKVAVLAYNCLNVNPKARPSMREVVDSLEPLQERNLAGNPNPTSPR